MPLFSLVPKNFGALFFRKSSKDADTVYQNIKTTRALEVMYGFSGKLKLTGTFLDSIFTYFWHHNIANAKGVRNRIRLVKREIKLAVENISPAKAGEPIKIFSIASGSARAVIEVMAELKQKGIKTEAKLLDLDPKALELSKKIAAEFDAVNQITEWCNDKASNFMNYCDGWRPDIIEMVGFLDYLKKEKAEKLFVEIYKQLALGGIFITANIRDNYEHEFVSRILNWEMVYRDDKDLIDLFLESGFKPKNCQIIFEPTLIHGVAIGKK